MGGSVAFAIKRDGVIQTREFGKSAVYEVCTVEFFRGKGEVMRLWKNSINEVFAPVDYGLVAVDFDNRWVGSIQDYCSLDKKLFYGTNTKDFRAEAASLFKAGRLRGFQAESREIMPVGDLSFDEWFESLRAYQKKTSSNSAMLDVAPPKGWTFEQYNNDAFGWERLVRALVQRDWAFDQASMSQWGEFMEEKNLPPSVIGAAISSLTHEKLEGSTPQVSTPVPGRRF